MIISVKTFSFLKETFENMKKIEIEQLILDSISVEEALTWEAFRTEMFIQGLMLPLELDVSDHEEVDYTYTYDPLSKNDLFDDYTREAVKDLAMEDPSIQDVFDSLEYSPLE